MSIGWDIPDGSPQQEERGDVCAILCPHCGETLIYRDFPAMGGWEKTDCGFCGRVFYIQMFAWYHALPEKPAAPKERETQVLPERLPDLLIEIRSRFGEILEVKDDEKKLWKIVRWLEHPAPLVPTCGPGSADYGKVIEDDE